MAGRKRGTRPLPPGPAPPPITGLCCPDNSTLYTTSKGLLCEDDGDFTYPTPCPRHCDPGNRPGQPAKNASCSFTSSQGETYTDQQYNTQADMAKAPILDSEDEFPIQEKYIRPAYTLNPLTPKKYEPRKPSALRSPAKKPGRGPSNAPPSTRPSGRSSRRRGR